MRRKSLNGRLSLLCNTPALKGAREPACCAAAAVLGQMPVASARAFLHEANKNAAPASSSIGPIAPLTTFPNQSSSIDTVVAYVKLGLAAWRNDAMEGDDAMHRDYLVTLVGAADFDDVRRRRANHAHVVALHGHRRRVQPKLQPNRTPMLRVCVRGAQVNFGLARLILFVGSKEVRRLHYDLAVWTEHAPLWLPATLILLARSARHYAVEPKNIRLLLRVHALIAYKMLDDGSHGINDQVAATIRCPLHYFNAVEMQTVCTLGRNGDLHLDLAECEAYADRLRSMPNDPNDIRGWDTFLCTPLARPEVEQVGRFRVRPKLGELSAANANRSKGGGKEKGKTPPPTVVSGGVEWRLVS